MLIKLTPQAPHPTVLFTVSFANLPETLPCPLSWANQLNCLSADELDVPTNHHCLDKAAIVPNLLENVTFDLNTMMASCSFVDGVMVEWPIADPGCLNALMGVVSDVSDSALEAERERLREKEEERQRTLDLMTPPPSPTKPKGHKKQRSLLMTIVACFSCSPGFITTLFEFATDAANFRAAFTSSFTATFNCFFIFDTTVIWSFSENSTETSAVYTCRYIPAGGYYAWLVQSNIRRASMRILGLVEKSGGYIHDIGRPRVDYGPDAMLDTTTVCTPTSLYDDDDDTDTDGSSVHTPSSSHFNTMTSAYTAQFASQSDPSFGRQPSSYDCPRYTQRCLLTGHEIEEYHYLSNFVDRLQRLFASVQVQNERIDGDNAHNEAILEIRSRRRAWLNRSLAGGAHHSPRNIGLSMPFRRSPLAHTSWTSEDYDLVMTPVNLDSFMDDSKQLEPDYEAKLSEGVSRLRLSDGPKLFPVLEESEGEVEEDPCFVSREFGAEFGVDLEGGMHGFEHRAAYETADGDMVIGSEGLRVEFDAPQIRPRLRTSSMMQRRRFDNAPLSETEFPPSPTSIASSPPRTPSSSPNNFCYPSPHLLDSSSLLCQPIQRAPSSPSAFPSSSDQMTVSRTGMELERSSPSVSAQVHSDMDVDMCVYDYSGGGHRVQHPDEEFTLGMDIPVKLRVHVPSPTRGRKPPPPPGYTMGVPVHADDDDWIVNSSNGVIIDCR
ncbi:hypothetical protein ONZ45_g2671 [Pleurotus djamor]|nr:hypothetical protein ONZ45_g2671 [Pleurotus djamor]